MPVLPRSGFFLAGILIFGIGVADTITGRLKVAQYEEMVRAAPPLEPPTAPALFPTASEGQERLGIARAKLAFYQLLTTVGWGLTALGCVVLTIGILRAPPPAVAPRPRWQGIR